MLTTNLRVEQNRPIWKKMLNRIKDRLREKLPLKYKHQWHLLRGFIRGFQTASYAQFGEDLILRSFFPLKKNGFFVDIGAFHPKFISNTYFFYKRGWRGINIDPTPKSMKLFRKRRPRDVNLELAISDQEEELTLYGCSSPSLNTFSQSMLEERMSFQLLELEFEKKIRPRTLSSVLDQYLPKNQAIDFFSIDAEGFDLKVLKSNDWDKYAPQAIVVESPMDFEPSDLSGNEISLFLAERGYKLISMTPANLIFVRNTYKIER